MWNQLKFGFNMFSCKVRVKTLYIQIIWGFCVGEPKSWPPSIITDLRINWQLLLWTVVISFLCVNMVRSVTKSGPNCQKNKDSLQCITVFCQMCFEWFFSIFWIKLKLFWVYQVNIKIIYSISNWSSIYMTKWSTTEFDIE